MEIPVTAQFGKVERKCLWAEVKIESPTSIVMVPWVTAALCASTHQASQKGFIEGEGEKGREAQTKETPTIRCSIK